MKDTSKYPHQSAAWVLFIVFVLLFLSGTYYYVQGTICYNESFKMQLSGIYSNTQTNVQSCNDYNIGMLMFALSVIPITTFGVCLIPEDRMKCPKCGYEFGGV